VVIAVVTESCVFVHLTFKCLCVECS